MKPYTPFTPPVSSIAALYIVICSHVSLSSSQCIFFRYRCIKCMMTSLITMDCQALDLRKKYMFSFKRFGAASLHKTKREFKGRFALVREFNFVKTEIRYYSANLFFCEPFKHYY